MITLVISYLNPYKSGLSLFFLSFILILSLRMAEVCKYATGDVEAGLAYCSWSWSVEILCRFHKVELVGLVFGHVLLHTGKLLRNNCILSSSPEGVYVLYPSCRVSSFSLESPYTATCSLSQGKWDSSPVSRDPQTRNVLSCLSSSNASEYWDLT